jgi:predicted RNA-binding protein associated with RNAse of E/G family
VSVVDVDELGEAIEGLRQERDHYRDALLDILASTSLGATVEDVQERVRKALEPRRGSER